MRRHIAGRFWDRVRGETRNAAAEVRLFLSHPRGSVDRWAERHADRPPERNPKVIAFLVSLAYNLIPTSAGLGGTLPTPAQQFAATFVVIGCIGCVVGLLLPNRIRLDTGVVIEIGGVIILGLGCLMLAAAIGEAGLTPLRAAVTVGLGVGSILRAIQLGLYVRGRRLIGEHR